MPRPPPPPVDNTSALANLASTPCAPSHSLSLSRLRSMSTARRPPSELPELPPPCSRCLAASQCLLPPLRAPHWLPRARTCFLRAGKPSQGAKSLVGECAASPELSAVSMSPALPFLAFPCFANARTMVAVTPSVARGRYSSPTGVW